MDFLKGYKTYVAATVSIVGTLAAVFTGEISLVDAIQIIVPAVIGAFVRNGIG